MQIPYATKQAIIFAQQGILTRKQGILPVEFEVVPETADAADVPMKSARERGRAPYRLHLDPQQHARIAVVIDWQCPPDFLAVEASTTPRWLFRNGLVETNCLLFTSQEYR